MRLDGATAFLVTKPLQLIIAMLVVADLQFSQKPVFIIVKSFSGAERVSQRLTQAFENIDVKYIENHADAYAYIGKARFTHVFIDSDVGLKKTLILARLRYLRQIKHIYVFEEGLGTYRTDIYHGIKARVFSNLGIATSFGKNALIEKVFVLQPDEYIENFPELIGKVVAIRGKVSDLVSENLDRFRLLFDVPDIPSPRDSRKARCCIYLTSWTLDANIIAHLRTLDGDVFIKPHPHIQDSVAVEGFMFLDAGVPAELLLIDLLQRYTHVDVFDHTSSVRRYIQQNHLFYTDMRYNDAS